ncbi:MAG: hypothetical protein ACFCVE_15915 [Phycisphaerae bacterium]
MSDIPEGYALTPEADAKRALAFFERGRTVAATGNYDYAIEMYLSGLEKDPEAIDAHRELRDISLKRKVSGGKPLGMFAQMKLGKGKDDKSKMLTAEKLLSYDPGSIDHMANMLKAAYAGGYYDTCLWLGPILFRANSDLPEKKRDFGKFILLRDIFRELRSWDLAVNATNAAVQMKPEDMDLNSDLKNLAAQQTMDTGGYEGAGSFRDSIRDKDKQQELIEQDRDIRSADSLSRSVAKAEAEWKAEPNEPGKLMKYVDALVKTEDSANEEKAMNLLQETYEQTKQFRFRFTKSRIRLAQLSREERQIRQAVGKNPTDESLKQQYQMFMRAKAAEELAEYEMAAENYPTDMGLKYQIGLRQFQLEQFDASIPLFQQSMQDPKFRDDATLLLGRSFLGADYIDEAVDTFEALVGRYQMKGDDRSKAMHYWYGRALEKKGETDRALKNYSQLAQWDFGYRDVQQRIKALRTG